MYISLDWTNELVNIQNIKLEDIIEKLTLGGFEVEEIFEIEINKKTQIILDITATANRADSLSIKGIAKEISVLLNEPISLSKYTQQKSQSFEKVKQTLLSSKKSIKNDSFLALTIENLHDLTVPKWITEKLISSQIQPLNNLLDFQTYILLETGYPFEFYDLEKIHNNLQTDNFNLSLELANDNEQFVATNNIEYKLNSNIHILKANNLTLSIAGIISNADIAITDKTTSLLIECSIFNSQRIRQEARILGLRTERSARYEKGLNNSYFIDSVIRLVYLLKISNPKLRCKIHTASKLEEQEIPNINLNYENIIRILGPSKKIFGIEQNLQLQEINEYLSRLNFAYVFNSDSLTWSVNIPKSRTDDIQREIDIIEEIGRLHGFNNFATNLPVISNIGIEDASYKIRKKLTNCFLNEGFNELIQYSLVDEQTSEAIKLLNPLLSDCSTLRTSLLPNLIQIVSENSKQSNTLLDGFEYGHIFSAINQSNYTEQEVVGGIFGGLKFKQDWSENLRTISWFEAKGKIEDLFKKLDIEIIWKNSSNELYHDLLHPYRSAELCLKNNTKISLGVFGQIHPISAKKNNVSSNLFLFEFKLQTLEEILTDQKLTYYKPYSSYPKITKDLSFIFKQNIPFEDLVTTIRTNSPDFLTNISLLDQYRGEFIPKDSISICLQLTFQSSEKTLVTKEIEEIIKDIQNILEKVHNITIRT